MTETTSAVSVMVVDDHPIWRNGVARDLAERGFEVLATASDGEAAVRIARTVRPAVVLMMGRPSSRTRSPISKRPSMSAPAAPSRSAAPSNWATCCSSGWA